MERRKPPCTRPSIIPPNRPGAAARAGTRLANNGGARPPTSRSGLGRHVQMASRAASPAESVASMATTATTGTKRKERSFEQDSDVSEATNINVVVRCRGRNEREVRENSAVVVATEGVKGKLVELGMGPSALSNKTYNFDRVFSPAADQSMIFDDVVKPILDEMLAGFNCTIFAYGQTGTGKTYTMSGDMCDTLGMMSDAAGIIPRVLHSLFNKLEIDDTDNCVSCSFIELYNEELRDLLSADENTRLKIYDDTSRKGHAATVVQGMEERHITCAREGLKWLQEGSVRRQVAATKCNDLSSRSHTVFTITVLIKRQSETGEDYISAGKLNLVDLAGSENIQRSGAENKRATEAGLINKSLLTLGRVINALVDRSSHIPYRESKLTRLLQDSLGGRTKTCIIATVSPAKSNLEETISTLDYAFRAKNIKNKPQLNATIHKKTLLKELTMEIERLKSELIATRQRNGVYLSTDAYEEMTVQNESRRILNEEQGAKIETLETNLRNKVQDLFNMTSSFMGLKKDFDGTREQLDETKEVLDQTELVLATTRKTLAEETHMRKAHEQTEEKLTSIGGELLTTLRETVDHVSGLRAKNKRKSDLQALNRSTWSMSQAQVSSVTAMVEGRIEELRTSQEQHMQSIADRMQSFVAQELGKLSSTQTLMDQNLATFAASKKHVLDRTEQSKQEMDDVLEEIKLVRDQIKQRVGESLQAVAGAATRIAADVLSELAAFHKKLHGSYSSLGKDCKSVFEDLLRHIGSQKSESDRLRKQLQGASDDMVQSNCRLADRIRAVLAEERSQAAAERQSLLAQITTLINAQAELQESRLTGRTDLIRQAVLDANKTFESAFVRYGERMDASNERDARVADFVTQSRDALQTRLKEDWTTANTHSTWIQNSTKSVHAETVRVVDEQLHELDEQMHALDDFVTRARSQNAAHYAQHGASMGSLADAVESSLGHVASHFVDQLGRVERLGDEVSAETGTIQKELGPVLDTTLTEPLRHLREDMDATVLREYEPTGDTPEKTQWKYPTSLPRTLAHDKLLATMRDDETAAGEGLHVTPSRAAGPQAGFGDAGVWSATSPPPPAAHIRQAATVSVAGDQQHGQQAKNQLSMSLREVNPNVTTGAIGFDPSASLMPLQVHNENLTMPLFSKSSRRATRNSAAAAAAKKLTAGAVGNTPAALPTMVEGGGESSSGLEGAAGNWRKSPRLH